MRTLILILGFIILSVNYEKVEYCHLYNLTIINYSPKKIKIEIEGNEALRNACGELETYWSCSFDELEPGIIKIEIFDFETNELLKEKQYNLNRCEEVFEIK